MPPTRRWCTTTSWPPSVSSMRPATTSPPSRVRSHPVSPAQPVPVVPTGGPPSRKARPRRRLANFLPVMPRSAPGTRPPSDSSAVHRHARHDRLQRQDRVVARCGPCRGSCAGLHENTRLSCGWNRVVMISLEALGRRAVALSSISEFGPARSCECSEGVIRGGSRTRAMSSGACGRSPSRIPGALFRSASGRWRTSPRRPRPDRRRKHPRLARYPRPGRRRQDVAHRRPTQPAA